jgi:tetratricopeptide (TPR) repeat protein
MHSRFSTEEHFQLGVRALEGERYAEALGHFGDARRLDPDNPRFCSYYGLCLALGERRFDEAISICRAAAREEFFNPALYRNLARVHLAFGFKSEGIRYLRRGLMIDPENEVIAEELTRLGVRQSRALHFLPRGHRVNRWLGRFRARMTGTHEASDPLGAHLARTS